MILLFIKNSTKLDPHYTSSFGGFQLFFGKDENWY